MRPVICLIAERARAGGDAASVVARVAAAARAGVHLVQIRDRSLEAGELTSLAARCVEAVRSTRTRILVNDRIDVALAAGAHGVHLRGDSVPASRVRPLVPAGFLIGRSVRSPDEARRAAEEGGLDYLIFGTVFATASKPGVAGAGLAALACTADAVTLPVLAIGGITRATLPGVQGAGAAGFAAIGLFADPPADQLQVLVNQASRAFDTPGGVP